jgi:hypothetical protein
MVKCFRLSSTLLSMFVNFGLVYLVNIYSRATKAHTGAYLAARIAECLRGYGIQNKVSVGVARIERESNGGAQRLAPTRASTSVAALNAFLFTID